MPSDRPDPSEFLAQAQKMLRQLFGETEEEGADPWARATRSARVSREPSPEEQRENLTFALATRAVEALEDLALNVAAIRQRLERTEPQKTEPQKTEAQKTEAQKKPPAKAQPKPRADE